MAPKTPSWEFTEICASKTLNCLPVREQRKLKQQKVHQIVFCKLEPEEVQFRKYLPACLDLRKAGVSHSTGDWKVLFHYHNMIHDLFTHSGFACLVMRRADQISTSRQPRFSHTDQWKEGWASFYGNQLVFFSPLRLPVCNEHVLAHRMNFHQVKTEKHERAISSMVVSSLQWWSWITRRNVAPLSVESVPASHTSLTTVEARWVSVLDASTVLVAKLEIKMPQKTSEEDWMLTIPMAQIQQMWCHGSHFFSLPFRCSPSSPCGYKSILILIFLHKFHHHIATIS